MVGGENWQFAFGQIGWCWNSNVESGARMPLEHVGLKPRLQRAALGMREEHSASLPWVARDRLASCVAPQSQEAPAAVTGTDQAGVTSLMRRPGQLSSFSPGISCAWASARRPALQSHEAGPGRQQALKPQLWITLSLCPPPPPGPLSKPPGHEILGKVRVCVSGPAQPCLFLQGFWKKG